MGKVVPKNMGIIKAYRTAQLEATIVNDIKMLRKSISEATINERKNKLILGIGKLLPFYRASKDEEIRAEALEYTGSLIDNINPKYGIRIYDHGLELISLEISKFNRGGYTSENFLAYKNTMARTGMFGSVGQIVTEPKSSDKKSK